MPGYAKISLQFQNISSFIKVLTDLFPCKRPIFLPQSIICTEIPQILITSTEEDLKVKSPWPRPRFSSPHFPSIRRIKFQVVLTCWSECHITHCSTDALWLLQKFLPSTNFFCCQRSWWATKTKNPTEYMAHLPPWTDHVSSQTNGAVKQLQQGFWVHHHPCLVDCLEQKFVTAHQSYLIRHECGQCKTQNHWELYRVPKRTGDIHI